MSYIATLTADTGLLLGGVKQHTSARFTSHRDCFDWGWTIRDTNRKAGRSVNPRIQIDEVSLPAEIPFNHS